MYYEVKPSLQARLDRFLPKLLVSHPSEEEAVNKFWSSQKHGTVRQAVIKLVPKPALTPETTARWGIVAPLVLLVPLSLQAHGSAVLG